MQQREKIINKLELLKKDTISFANKAEEENLQNDQEIERKKKID